MYENILNIIMDKPGIYQQGELKFWDDEHISKEMLKAHLNPTWDAATRNHNFIHKSAEWISELAVSSKERNLLDLGCGPGIYAEEFDALGFHVTGVDFSKRSIQYAKESGKKKGRTIDYYYQDYRTITFEEQFDVVTLIYSDYGVLSPEDRKCVANKIFKALKPGGIFILDAWTELFYKDFKEMQQVSYSPQGGFWKSTPYACIQRNFRYEETDIFLEQHIILTNSTCNCYHIWNCSFDKQKLSNELKEAGFKTFDVFGDVSGANFREDSNTICIVARK